MMKEFFEGIFAALNTKAEETFSREFVADFKSGFVGFFKNIASFNNFVLLSLAYFVGVGLSYLLYKRSQKKSAAAPQVGTYKTVNTNSHWQEMDSTSRPTDSFYRPF